MKKVKFNAEFGQLAAVLAGKKTQFRNVENRLARLLDRDFTSQSVVDAQWIADEHLLAIRLNGGEVVEHRPDYAVGEVVEVEDTNARIRITGIRVARLCNPTMDDFWAEGFLKMLIDGCRCYAYQIEEKPLASCRVMTMPMISPQLAWNDLLYRTLDPMMVVCNPYSVVYQFELI